MNKITKTWIYRVIALIAGVSVLLALVHYAGFEQFYEIVLQASPRWIAAAALVYASSWTFRTWRLRLFTEHAGKKIGAFDLFKLYISGYALNVILPAKLGDVITVGYSLPTGLGLLSWFQLLSSRSRWGSCFSTRTSLSSEYSTNYYINLAAHQSSPLQKSCWMPMGAIIRWCPTKLCLSARYYCH